MKSKIILFLFLLGAIKVSAQSNATITHGGFGHFFVGPSYFQPGELKTYMQGPGILDGKMQSRPGLIIGGEGAGIIGRFLIGGGGFGENAMRKTNDSIRTSIGLGAGYFKFGYQFVQRTGCLAYIYGGVGGGGLNVQIENFMNEQNVVFNKRNPLGPRQKGNYNLPCFYYELGLSYKKMFLSPDIKGGQGGFMLGLDLGVNMLTPVNDWEENENKVVTGPPSPAAFFNPYIRLNIGGGGFNVQ